MKGLEQDEAVELFSWHAFMRSNPEEGFEDMTERIVNACGGLPLSLEIIGSHLYPKKDLRYWRDALQKLVFDDVYPTLKISYNALSFEEKQIFLDIACFFIRLKHNIFFGRRAYNMDFYVNFWSALGYRSVCTSLQNIEAKSLMTIQKHAYTQNVDEDEGGIDFEVDEYVSIFSMHDQIREMGRRIVEEESPNDRTNCSRVWRKEDIVSAMALTEEMPSLRGLMCKRKLELDHMDSVASMPKLQFLLWWNLFLKREIKTLPRNLRYLIFGNCRLKAHNIDLKAIEVADSDGRSIGSSWFSQLMGLIPFPSFFGVSKELEFGSCLPKSIGQLKFLRYLDMSGTKQTFLPEEVGELSSLEELYLFRCYLKALPQSFGNLAKLKIVDLSSNLLLRFPESFQRLKSLVDLKAVKNKELMKLSNLPRHLVNLNVRNCSKLTEVQGMNGMSRLQSVDLSRCKSLRKLPFLFCVNLRKLKLGGCEKLEALPVLPSGLTSLDIWGCSQLQEIPDIIYYAQGGGGFLQGSELQANFGPAEDGFREAERLCMIGCDIPKINIYGLLEKWPNLELLEVSRTLLEELPGKSKNDCVASPFNFQVRGPTRCKAILFCFVLSSNGENVRVPEMHVEVSGMASEIGMTGWTMPEMRRREIVKKFKLPQCKYSDGSGKSIIRICILKEELRAYVFEEGDNIKCWYKVEEPFPQGGCLVREAQVLLLPEEVGDFDDVIQCLRKWKLLDGPCSPLRERYGFPVVFCHDRRPLVL